MRDADLARIRRTAKAVIGPGMATTIRGDELWAILNRLDDVERENEKLRAQPVKTNGKTPPAEPWLTELPAVVAAFGEIIEACPELWGTPALEALEAYAAQTGDPLPDDVVVAVKRSLGQS